MHKHTRNKFYEKPNQRQILNDWMPSVRCKYLVGELKFGALRNMKLCGASAYTYFHSSTFSFVFHQLIHYTVYTLLSIITDSSIVRLCTIQWRTAIVFRVYRCNNIFGTLLKFYQPYIPFVLPTHPPFLFLSPFLIVFCSDFPGHIFYSNPFAKVSSFYLYRMVHRISHFHGTNRKI